MKIVKTLLFMVLFASLLCIAALAADAPGSGISGLSVVDEANTTITMQEANKDEVTDTNGVFIGAERYTVSYNAGIQNANKEYAIFVLSGTDSTPTASNILYIDQARAKTDGTVTFNCYPSSVTGGGTIYISGDTTLVELARYGYFDGTNAFTVSLSDEVVQSGGKVSVNVNLSNNPGFGAMTLYVYYDPNLLTYNDRTFGEMWNTHKNVTNVNGETNTLSVNLTDEATLKYNDGDTALNEPIIAIGLLTDKDISTSSGTLVSLNFTAAQVSEAVVTDLPLICIKSSNNQNSSSSIYTIADSGSVNIRIYILGDVDDDGMFTASDALMALQIAVGKTGFTETQRLASNVDGDTLITASDALMILQRAVGKITNF